MKGPFIIIVGLLKLYHATRNALLCAALYAVLLGWLLWMKEQGPAITVGASLIALLVSWGYFQLLGRIDDESWTWWAVFFAGGIALTVPLL
jgi:hypothetical protein